jgi:hypothetical protein
MSNKVAICELCGNEYVKVSNRQKYCCNNCKKEAKSRNMQVYNKARNAKIAAKDIRPVSLGASLPKSAPDDWEKELKKVKAEKKRVFAKGRGSANGAVSAREIALNDLVFDERDSDFKGSIESFFNGDDDE